MRRAAALPTLIALAACTGGLERGAEAISRSPTPSVAPAPGTTAATGSTRDRTIVVRSPQSGDEVVSPVEVSGTADVFEATVSISILDANGVPLASTSTSASCGSGCRGTYATSIAFFVEARQPGTIQVFERSAEDGTAQHLVEVPVTLVPGG